VITGANHRVEVSHCPEWGYDRIHFRATSIGAGDRPAEPVRIFLGTEASQWRAERVFLWSVTRFGDPARDYEVHRMTELGGFDPSAWTTGFTNYRFGIPTLAGGRGRAIYNDVDQVYLTDPARLFDSDLGRHGFLARAKSETSVMLLDCARMHEVWNLDVARADSKRVLQARAAAVSGLRGPLESHWNARDNEYDRERPGVLHFTTLHTQPWRPFPLQFEYEPHTLAAVWRKLEAEADAAGFELYTGRTPSVRFVGWLAAQPRRDALPEEPLAALATACGVEKVERLNAAALREWLDGPRVPNAQGALGCVADWARIPAEDLSWVLDALLRSAERLLVLFDRGDSHEAACALEARLERAAERHPEVTWHFRSEAAGQVRLRNGGPAPAQQRGDLPRVWVLHDDRAGNSTQSSGLAQALGWPVEEKAIRFERGGQAIPADLEMLRPPWPDLVIAAGRRLAPVALALRERAQGAPRLVQLGRKGGAEADRYDLVVTPRAARLWPHPRRLETLLPVCQEIGTAALPAFRDAAAPRVALLIGGSTGRLRMDSAAVKQLARDTGALHAALGGTLWISTSRRSPADAEKILGRELPGARIYRWRPGDPDNPYLGLLAHADILVVTGESESALAEAAASTATMVIARAGRTRSPTLAQRVGEWVVAYARRRPVNNRGTPRPQRGLVRRCAGLVATGRVRPLRDLEGLQRGLVEGGRAHLLEEVLGDPTRLKRSFQPIREAPRVAARVRALFDSRAHPS
jgi:mitochondrial fission protein ELM1